MFHLITSLIQRPTLGVERRNVRVVMVKKKRNKDSWVVGIGSQDFHAQHQSLIEGHTYITSLRKSHIYSLKICHKLRGIHPNVNLEIDAELEQ